MTEAVAETSAAFIAALACTMLWGTAHAEGVPRCEDKPSALAVVVYLQAGQDLKGVEGCVIGGAIGTVVNSTSDGWTIVRAGDSTFFAIHTKRVLLDDSLYQWPSLKFIGVRRFPSTLGRVMTLATFAEMKPPSPGSSSTPSLSATNTAKPTNAPTSSCDMSGRWNLVLKWKGKHCGSPESRREFLVRRSRDGQYRTLDGSYEATATRNASGKCQLGLLYSSEDSVHDFYVTDDHGAVNGDGEYTDVSKCERTASITGTRTPVSDSDFAFTDARKKEYRNEFFRQVNANCTDLPFLQVHEARAVNWELVIAANGRPRRFTVDNVDQRIDERCAKVIEQADKWIPFLNLTEREVIVRGRTSVTGASPATNPAIASSPSTAPPSTDLHGDAGNTSLLNAPVKTLPDIDSEACGQTVKYPNDAFQHGIEGEVKLRVALDESGKVRDIRVLHGLGHGLDEAAMNALRTKCKFTPAIGLDGNPVPYVMESYTWNFELPR